MNRMDWLLSVIAAGKDTPLQPVQLQKALFLISVKVPRKELGKDFYEFSPYDYGPFSSTIYQDAERLEGEGLVSVSSAPQMRYKLYSATPLGAERAEQISAQLPGNVSQYIERVVDYVQSLSFGGLVRAIYKHYPDWEVNSVFRK